MSETKHLKCPCGNCGGSIEFPAHGIGSAVNCPHCGEKTTLFAPPIDEASIDPGDPDGSGVAAADEAAASSEPPTAQASEPPTIEPGDRPTAPRKGKLVWRVLLVLAAGLVAAGVFLKSRPPQQATSSKEKAKPFAKSSSLPPPTNAEAAQSDTPPPPKVAKSANDLKVGAIALEKSKGSSLIYAVGVLRNDSDYQRFGVTIELALSDARGNRAGTAKDYRGVLEPRQEWRFRALVLDSKAVSAQVERVREEE
jgi:hypothetical protein